MLASLGFYSHSKSVEIELAIASKGKPIVFHEILYHEN